LKDPQELVEDIPLHRKVLTLTVNYFCPLAKPKNKQGSLVERV